MKSNRPSAEKRGDLIFAAIALIMIVIMIAVLIKYTGLRKEKEEMTAGYASVTEELITARQERSELESEIERIKQELNDLNKQISALGGNG